jgi:hypothetical protein
MEGLTIVQAIALIASASGGSTWAVMRVHIAYITRTHERHEQRLNGHDQRLSAIESGRA